MANTIYTRTDSNGLGLDLSAMIYNTIQRLSDYRIYRKTVNDLSNLSNAELADLGLGRSMIQSVARKAVYGV